MSIIKAINVIHDFISRDYNDNEYKVRALDGVNFEVSQGQFISILGHNGSGKSSLAKHINALLTPTEGTLIVSDMDTKSDKDKVKIRQKAGMVFQNPDNQLVASVVEEDVAFGPENLGLPNDEIWKRINKALADVNMTAYRYKSPDKLSGGQKQKVAIAGVMAMEPSCIILDEPTAMLDPKGRTEIIKSLHALNREKGITILLITHHVEETIDSDKIFVMSKGKIILEGKPSDVYAHADEINEAGLEVPVATKIAYELNKKGINIDCNVVDTDELIEKIDNLYKNKRSNSV